MKFSIIFGLILGVIPVLIFGRHVSLGQWLAVVSPFWVIYGAVTYFLGPWRSKHTHTHRWIKVVKDATYKIRGKKDWEGEKGFLILETCSECGRAHAWFEFGDWKREANVEYASRIDVPMIWDD